VRVASLLVGLFAAGFVAAWCSSPRAPLPCVPCVFVESPGGYGLIGHARARLSTSPQPSVFVQSDTGAPIVADREMLAALAAICSSPPGAQ
jgi:hypothetical protein